MLGRGVLYFILKTHWSLIRLSDFSISACISAKIQCIWDKGINQLCQWGVPAITQSEECWLSLLKLLIGVQMWKKILFSLQWSATRPNVGTVTSDTSPRPNAKSRRRKLAELSSYYWLHPLNYWLSSFKPLTKLCGKV